MTRAKGKTLSARVWYKPFRMGSGENSASYTLPVGDDFQAASRLGRTSAVLTLSLRGIGQIDDVEVRINDTPVKANGYHYNQSDHSSYSDVLEYDVLEYDVLEYDVLEYDVPVSALRQGENSVKLQRVKENSGFAGSIEVRKLILDIKYP